MSDAPRCHNLMFAALAIAACSSGSSSGFSTAMLGMPCDIGPAAGGLPRDGTIATITSPALECPSQMCLLPAMEKLTDTGALCTGFCGSDADCAHGELGPHDNVTDRHCETGFTCMVPFTVGSFACRKMCVCIDFVAVPPGGFQTPVVCSASGGGG